MKNQYPAICFRCGQRVAPECGQVVSVPYSTTQQWKGYQRPMRGELFVEHTECAEAFHNTIRHYLYAPHG